MKKFFNRYKILLSVLLVAVVCVGGTLAYLAATDNPVLNTFALAKVGTHVEEDSGGTESSKVVTIKNTSTTASDEFVRALVVVSAGVSKVEFVSAEPAVKAADTIYVVIGGNWEKSGDYYYYKALLQSGTSTTALVNGVYCGSGVDANSFDVDVYAEAVLGSGTYSLTAAQSAFAGVSG